MQSYCGNKILGIFNEMSWKCVVGFTDDKSALAQGLVWYDQFASHYLSPMMTKINDSISADITSQGHMAVQLTHCGLMMSYGNTKSGQYWLQQWLVAWRHQATTLSNDDLSSVWSHDIHLRALSYKHLKMPISDTRLKTATVKDVPINNDTLLNIQAC